MIEGTYWEDVINPPPQSAEDRMHIKAVRKRYNDVMDKIETMRITKRGE